MATTVSDQGVAALPPTAGSPTERAWRRRRSTATLRRGVFGVLVFFAFCQLVTWMEPVNREFLPLASTVVWRMVRLLGDGEFMDNVRSTLQAWFTGLVVAVAIAVPLGVVLGSFRAVYRVTRTVIELIRPVPAVAVLPLAILMLGQGVRMKATLVAFAALWPILYNTIYGVHDVDPLAKDTARAFGYGRAAVLGRVVLPSAAPFIATGVRVSASIGLVVVVSAELLAGGDAGIGSWVMRMGSSPGNADLVYAGSLFAAALGYVLNLVLERSERALFGWRDQAAGGGTP